MKINLNIFKRRVAPFILTAGLLPTLVGCSNTKTGSNSYSITTSNEHDENLLKPLKKKGFKISEIEVKDNFNIYKLENNISDYFNTLNGDIYNIYQPFDYNKCCTPIEFKEYIGSDNITYTDIKNTLNNNTNIDSNIKDILMEGINNLENNNLDIDLTVLNYNLSNLDIEYVTIDEKDQVEIMAKFEAINHRVLINPNVLSNPLFKTILIHEVLGHASNIAYLDKDGGIYCSTTFSNVMIEGNDRIIGYNNLGTAFEEGIAEYIRYYATNEKIDPNQTSYSVGLYMLLFMTKSCNLSVNDYINNGVESLINKLQDNNLGSVVHFIELFDIETTYKSFTNREVDWTYNDIMYQYLLVYTSDLYENGKSKDEIKNDINKLCNSNTKMMELITTEDGYKVVYTPSINGDDVLQYEYVENSVYEYVDYIFEGNKVISFK